MRRVGQKMFEERPSVKNPGFATYALRYVIMWITAFGVASGFMQVLNAFQQKGTIFELDLPGWLPTYLIITGLVKLVLNGFAYIGLRNRDEHKIWLSWLAIGFNVLIYWFQFFILWHPDQRLNPPYLTLVFHLLGLALLAWYTYLISKKETADGQGD